MPNEKNLQLAAANAQMPLDLVKLTWNTVASAARNMNDFLLFLIFCRENQVSALRGEATMQIRRDNRTGLDKPVFVVSYQVFIRRALKAGFLIAPMAVHEKDDFAFDAGNFTVRHKFTPDRGNVVGAYAIAKLKRTMQHVAGMYLSISELQQNTPTWQGMRATMATKTVAERLARYCIEELANLHGAEEMGIEIPRPTPELANQGFAVEASFTDMGDPGEAKTETLSAIESHLSDEDNYHASIARQIALRKCQKHGVHAASHLDEQQQKELLADLTERFKATHTDAAVIEPPEEEDPKPSPELPGDPATDPVKAAEPTRTTAQDIRDLSDPAKQPAPPEDARPAAKKGDPKAPVDIFGSKVPTNKGDEWMEAYWHAKKLSKASPENMATVRKFLDVKKRGWVAELTGQDLDELIRELERGGE